MSSVIAQTFADWELIVFDNGENGVENLIPHDERIRYVRGKADGPASAFQAALDLATGDIIHPLSDDDRLTVRALATADAAIGDKDWLVARTVLVDTNGMPVALRGGTWADVEATRYGSYMLGGAVYWRKSLTDTLGGFDTSYDGAADAELYPRFLRHSEPARSRAVLYLHTVHPEQDSIANQERQAEATHRARSAA